MKVQNNAPQGTSQASQTSGAKKAGKASESGKPAKAGAPVSGDAKAEISPRAREFSRAKEAAGKAPDVREERVADIKRRIAEGKYEVSPEAVANRLVDDHLSMSFD